MIEFDPDGTIRQANENFLGAVGYGLEEIAGQHHRMFCEPGYAQSAEYAEFWKSLARGEFHSGEFQRRAKGGREMWLQATYNPILGSSGEVTGVVKFASDITEAKTQAAEIQGKMSALDRSQAVIEFDPDGTIRQANENFLGAVGYSLEEIAGQHHRMFCEPELAQSSEYAEFWKSLARGEFQGASSSAWRRAGG